MRVKLCVRCGIRERAEEAYLCAECRYDPITQSEVQRAALTGLSPMEQRAWLVKNSLWRGKWSPRG